MDIEQYIKKLEKLKQNISDVQSSVEQACLLVENEAKMNCPVDTGRLRGSITHEIETTDKEVAGYVGTNVEYAPYVEYGTGIYSAKGNGRQTPWSYKDAKGDWHYTRGQSPQPFLYPALAHKKEQILEIINRSIKEDIDNV